VGAFFIAILAAGGILHAQIAAEMDALLETPAINFVQASRFVLAAADIFQADDYPSAFDLAREKGWLPKKASSDSQVRLGELCFLVMGAFGMRGSFLYTLFPGPRYAFRELDYLRMIPGRRDPARRVSGEEMLRILDMVTAGENVDWAAETPVSETSAPEPTIPEPTAYPVGPPAPPESVAAAAEEWEQMAVVIRAKPEEHEVGDTAAEAGRAVNRRVEIILLDWGQP
jgi:hypothetical protein